MPLSLSALRRVVDRVEDAPTFGPELIPLPTETPTIEAHYCKVTSTTKSSSWYPAKRFQQKSTADGFDDPSNTVWIYPSFGETLRTGVYLPCKLLGTRASDGIPVFSTMLVEPVYRGKLDGTLSYQGSATMSIWYYNGSAEADTGDNVTVYDWHLSSGQTVASGKQGSAWFDMMSGRYYFLGTQCA